MSRAVTAWEGDDAAVAVIPPGDKPDQRLGRILSTVARFRRTVCVKSIDQLRPTVGQSTLLIGCDLVQAEAIAGRWGNEVPNAKLMVWTRNADRGVYSLASKVPRIASLMAWPEDAAIPRPWELAIAVRRLVCNDVVPFSPRDFLQGGAIKREWSPRTTADIGLTLDDLGSRVEQVGADKRTARRVMGVAHEMLMNAMYDAPLDDAGRARFAGDRTQVIDLDPRDAPRLLLATDGLSLVLQVSDRFGGLCREHVYDSLQRGFRSGDHDAQRDEGINQHSGGAGIGIHRIFSGSNATVFDVVSTRSTVVTAVFELDRPHRDLRAGPRSLHFFRRSESAGTSHSMTSWKDSSL